MLLSPKQVVQIQATSNVKVFG